MRVLAIETSSQDVAVALADESGPIVCLAARSGRRHVELLHPLVEQACKLAGVALSDVEAVAVDVGPGQFTGIRVGVAAAKGFATALAVPVVALTSLEILRVACEARGAGAVVPVVDLRRGEVAWSLALEEIDFGSPERLAGLIADVDAPVVLAGDGAIRYGLLLSGGSAGEPSGAGGRAADGEVPRLRTVAGAELASPPVASLAVRAVAEAQAGRAMDPLEVLPVYLRDADARINWTTRHDAPSKLVPARGGP